MRQLREIGFVLVLAAICTVVMSGGDILLRPPPGASPEFMSRALELAASLAGSQTFAVPAKTASGTEEADRLAATFQAEFISVRGADDGLYRARRLPDLMLCEQEGNGMWGKIRLLVALDTRTGLLADVSVIAQTETPGLGTRIADPEFERPFTGLPATSGVRLATGTARPDAGEVSAITGATVSCAAVVQTVNAAMKRIGR